ncbi:MAG: PfkB family carbohydrate kinase [Pseudomonadota bacterium]
MSHDSRHAPVLFGEVLFDEFTGPDGEVQSVLGGAPFNVAWHLAGFGIEPLLISRVGDDALGERVRNAMAEHGLPLDGLQLDPLHPTGRVAVTLEAGEPSYDIVADVAFDHIDPDGLEAAVAGREPAALYHGTLAARSDTSRRALRALRHRLSAPIFIDVNLRAPWWEATVVKELLQGSHWVKLNGDEQVILGEQFRSPGVGAFRERLGAEALILTHGEGGAEWVDDSAPIRVHPRPVRDFRDAVGAGDALAAVFMLGRIRGWTARESLERGVEFAAAICGRQGALVEDPAFYDAFNEKWKS